MSFLIRWAGRDPELTAHARPHFKNEIPALRSAIRGDWKFIQARKWLDPRQRTVVAKKESRILNEGPYPDFDLWGEVVREELYDLREDPLETKNRLETEAERPVGAARAERSDERGRAGDCRQCAAQGERGRRQ